MDRVDEALRRHARLQFAVVPPMDVLSLFLPDDEGRVEEIDQQEARERKLPFYLSRRLCALDKVLETRDRIAVVVRHADNGQSLGERMLTERGFRDRQSRLDAAIRNAVMGRVSGRGGG